MTLWLPIGDAGRSRRLGAVTFALGIGGAEELCYGALAIAKGSRDLGPMQYVGFVFGLGCGSVVLTWL